MKKQSGSSVGPHFANFFLIASDVNNYISSFFNHKTNYFSAQREAICIYYTRASICMFYHGIWIRIGWEVAQNSFLSYIFMNKYQISVEIDTGKGLYALNATKCNILYSWELLLLFRRKVMRFLKAKMDVQAAKKRQQHFLHALT